MITLEPLAKINFLKENKYMDYWKEEFDYELEIKAF